MPRVYKKKRPEEGGRAWYDPKTLLNAIEAIKMGKMNQKTAAAFYGVPRSSIIRKMSGASKPGVSTGGRRLEFSEQEEENLFQYLKIISVCGEGLTKTQTRDLVQEYVKKYNIKTRFRDGRPGYDWYINFTRRHPGISRKRYEQYSMERCGSKDMEPFQVYKFYEDLQKLYNQSNYTENDGSLIYTFDECEFPWHTQDDNKTAKILNPPVMENTSVLACGSASGQQLSPFILFKGKFVQAPWVSAENRIPLESESELTERSIFETWFNRLFLNQIDSLTSRLHKPVTLIFTGSKSQTKNALTLNVFEQCVEHKINLIKLPQSFVWELQPLQKSCFKEMRTAWNDWKSKQDLSSTLSKPTFLRCLDEIWNSNVTAENLVLGFENSGIFPVNKKLFPKGFFRPSALWRYEAHVTEHIPETVFVVVDNEETKKPIISNETKLEVIETSATKFSTFTPGEPLDLKSFDVDELPSGKDPLHPVVREVQREKSKTDNAVKNTMEKKRVSNKFGKIMLMNEMIRQRAMFAKYKAKGSASTSARRDILRESHRKANSSRQGTDKEENLTLLSLLIDSKREEDHCSLLPEEISESGAEGLSSGSDPFDVEVTQHPKSVCFSPSSSAEVYNTGFPSCLSSSDNWHQRNESEVETSFLSNSPQLPGVINDACTKFFLSMSDTVRDLPPDLQIMAKRNVLHAVTECELTALNRLNMPKN